MTSIAGIGMTRFGKREEDLISLAVESSRDISARYSDFIDLVIVCQYPRPLKRCILMISSNQLNSI